ncbi:MAG: hypothetical protein HQK63_12055 [Desulfamplus sp.]|nr:hypothetical protein [Desulfamplus sp.]
MIDFSYADYLAWSEDERYQLLTKMKLKNLKFMKNIVLKSIGLSIQMQNI